MILQFNIGVSVLISFLVGIGAGLTLAILIYLIVVLSSMKSKKYIIKTQVAEVDNNEILDLIEQAKDQFNDNNLRKEQAYFNYAFEISKNLVVSIAKKFYPKSKYPLFEISIDELLMLGIYISKRLDEILNYKGLKFLRKFKVSYIASINDVKNNINENKIIKSTKKYKIYQAVQAARNVINIVNPVFWVRKFVTKNAMNFVIKKLCLVIISVSGEETFKIYSKSIYKKDVELNSGVNGLVDELADTIDENSDDVESSALEDQEESRTIDFFNTKKYKSKNKGSD